MSIEVFDIVVIFLNSFISKALYELSKPGVNPIIRLRQLLTRKSAIFESLKS